MSLADLKRGLSQGQSERTRVINGRLYRQAGDITGLYRPVPRGMDDARDLKGNPHSDYYVADNEVHEIFTPERMQREMQNGATAYRAGTEDAEPVSFLKTEDAFAISLTDEDGKIRFQTVEPGSYIGVGEDGNCFAVSEEDFAENYEVVSAGDTSRRGNEFPELTDADVATSRRELPEISESGNEADDGYSF